MIEPRVKMQPTSKDAADEVTELMEEYRQQDMEFFQILIPIPRSLLRDPGFPLEDELRPRMLEALHHVLQTQRPSDAAVSE